jgi:hypothetical protein
VLIALFAESGPRSRWDSAELTCEHVVETAEPWAADLFDSDLDRVADALDTLNDAPENSKTDFGRHLDGSAAKLTLDHAVQR